MRQISSDEEDEAEESQPTNHGERKFDDRKGDWVIVG